MTIDPDIAIQLLDFALRYTETQDERDTLEEVITRAARDQSTEDTLARRGLFVVYDHKRYVVICQNPEKETQTIVREVDSDWIRSLPTTWLKTVAGRKVSWDADG